MAVLKRLIALVLLALCGFNAHASIPATSTTEYNCGYGWYPSINAAMSAHPSTQSGVFGAPYSFSSGNCVATRLSTGVPTVVNGGTTRTTSTCPANSTLAGAVCNCNSGYQQEGNVCMSGQEALCNALGGTETYASGPGNIAPGASSCNASGCMTTFASTLIRVKNPQGQYVTEGAATFTGATCTYSESSGSTEDTCPGGATGQVNGVTVCVPYDPQENTIETVGKSDSTTEEGGSTTSTSTTSNTTCSNGSCSTTTNITTSVNGGTPTTKTTTTSEPQDQFCKNNPTATQCKDAGSFTGNCNASFVCKGDAIQCATAKAANESLCEFREVFGMDAGVKADIKSFSERVMAGTEDPNPRDNPTVVNLGTFDQSNPLSSACPADIPVNLRFFSTVIPLSEHCGSLQMLGNMLVIFSLLGATIFVLRGGS